MMLCKNSANKIYTVQNNLTKNNIYIYLQEVVGTCACAKDWWAVVAKTMKATRANIFGDFSIMMVI